VTALEFAGVGHRYQRVAALAEMSFAVDAGEILCLLGPSGCGKSTLLRLAAGLEPLQQGTIRIAGAAVAGPGTADIAPERRNVGFVFQDYALFPHLTAAENVSFGLAGLAEPERRRRATEALEQVGMADLAAAYPHTLSGGQQQRVALARAMAPRPGLFLLDEPFSGLDARLRRRLLEDTWRLLKASGAASVVVTHDPEEAMLLGDRIAVMRAGRIEQIGPPAAVYARPATGFVAEFLSEVNRWRGTVEAGGTVETPAARVAARGLAPGAHADVFIRQTGIGVHAASPGPDAREVRVAWVRPIGSVTLLRLEFAQPDRPVRAAYARLSGPSPVAEGGRAWATVNPNEVFVFAAEAST
jgi:iron(III) transport system ATP-binding protein